MNRLIGLKQDLAARVEKAGAIQKKADDDNKRSLTAEEVTEMNTLLAEAEDIDKQIKAIELAEQEQVALRSRLGKFASVTAASGLRPEVVLTPGAPGAASQPSVQVHDRWTDKELLFGYAPAAGETAIERRHRRILGLGEQLAIVREAEMFHKGMLNKPVDKRLHELATRAEQRAAAAGASEAVPADGGFLIQPDFAEEIMLISHETGLVYTRGRKIPISADTNSLKVPGVDEQSRVDGSRWGGVRMYWENEADALIGTKPKFRMIELVMKKLTGLYYATNELLADARALGAVVMQAFGEELGFKLDDGFIRGTGAGQLQGVLNSPALISVAKETGQPSATVVYENIRKMWGRLWPRSRRNAVWFCNVDVEQQLFNLAQTIGIAGESVVSAAGGLARPVMLPPGGGTDYGDAYGTIFGRPVIPIEQADTLGNQGDLMLMDFSQFVYADKGDMQSAVSMHVRFLTDEMTYRWIYRVDGRGQWHTALSPYRGTSTLSPFITLAAR